MPTSEPDTPTRRGGEADEGRERGWSRRLRAPALALICAVLLALLAAPVAAQRPDPLGGLVAEALAGNLTLAQQRLAQARAAAAESQARGMYLPSLAVEARYSKTTGAMNLGQLVNPAYAALNRLTGTQSFPTNIDAQFPYAQETKLRLIQPVFQPAVHYGIALQKSLSGLESARTGAVARQVAADVQKAYLGAAKARKVVELYAATLSVLDENVRVAGKLLENGTATPDAVYRARAERDETAQQLAEAERQAEAATQYFDLVMGRPLDAPLPAVSDSLLDFPLDLGLEQARASALRNREELAQAERARGAARAQRGLAGASFLPGISLAIDYGIQGQEYRFDRAHDAAVASVILQWNLFNGGQDRARREEAALEADRAEVARRDAQRQVTLDVETAYQAATVARAAIGTARERLDVARRGFDLVARRYREGMASQIELLDARRALTAAGLNEILTRYDYATRYVELERAAALRPLGQLTEVDR